jgi:hypothetical protein
MHHRALLASERPPEAEAVWEPVMSVCVPAFERPELLRRLIESFLTQEGVVAELCISDDSRSDRVQSVVADCVSSQIRYVRTPQRLGFGRNLRHAISMAHGDFIVVLGDDDMLVGPEALSGYVDAARRHPDAGFLYPNLLQVDENARVTNYHRYFDEETYCHPGSEALASLWLRSVQIAGMGFRMPASAIVGLLPTEASLFPQVTAVGRILVGRGGVGIARYLCATGLSSTQLGYEAAVGRLVSAEPEKIGGAELVDIVQALATEFPEQMERVVPTLERRIALDFVGSMPNIRMFSGSRALRRLTLHMVRCNPRARRSLTLWIVYGALVVIPPPVVKGMVSVLKVFLRIRRRATHFQGKAQTVFVGAEGIRG